MEEACSHKAYGLTDIIWGLGQQAKNVCGVLVKLVNQQEEELREGFLYSGEKFGSQ